jgi:hypothetical protein
VSSSSSRHYLSTAVSRKSRLVGSGVTSSCGKVTIPTTRNQLQYHQQKRRLSSSGPSASSKPESKKDSPTLPNLALASVLFGFVTYVFFYSMNAVGRGDGEEDPLAQLKAEAHEAREAATAEQRKKLTPEEIQALESGMTGSGADGARVDVAVAAPEEIAALEEEANLKVFQRTQKATMMDGTTEQPKKKPWWRLGF